MATNTRNKLSVYDTKDISAPDITSDNTFIPAFKPGTNNYKVPVSSFYDTFQPTSGMTAYYDKTEVYNKTEVDSMIADFGGYEVVELVNDEPDVVSPDTKTIYLTKDDSITSGDAYKEWIWKAADPQDPLSTSAWDLIGDTSLDLSDYVRVTAGYTSGNIAQFGDDNTIEDTGYTVSDFLTHDDVPSIGIASGRDTVYSASNVLMYYGYQHASPNNIAIAFSGMPGEDSSAASGFLVPEPKAENRILATEYGTGNAMHWINHPIPQYDIDMANNVLTIDSNGSSYDWMPNTELINIDLTAFNSYTASSVADPNTFNEAMAILGRGHRPVIGVYSRQVTSGYDYTDFYPLVEIDGGCGLYFSDYLYNSSLYLHTQYWTAKSNNFIMTSGIPYDESIIRNYLNKEMPIRAKFNAVTDIDDDDNSYTANIYLNTMEYNSERDRLRWTGIYKHAAPYGNSSYHLMDLWYSLSASAWNGLDKTLNNSIFS